jgi:hypothetical protein
MKFKDIERDREIDREDFFIFFFYLHLFSHAWGATNKSADKEKKLKRLKKELFLKFETFEIRR